MKRLVYILLLLPLLGVGQTLQEKFYADAINEWEREDSARAWLDVYKTPTSITNTYHNGHEVEALTYLWKMSGDMRWYNAIVGLIDYEIGATKKITNSNYSEFYSWYPVDQTCNPDNPDTWVHCQIGTPLYESYLWRRVSTFLRYLYQSSNLRAQNPNIESDYQRLKAWTKKNMWDKWVAVGMNHLYRSRTHMASHWARIGYDLWVMEGRPETSLYKDVYRNIMYEDMPNYSTAYKTHIWDLVADKGAMVLDNRAHQGAWIENGWTFMGANDFGHAKDPLDFIHELYLEGEPELMTTMGGLTAMEWFRKLVNTQLEFFYGVKPYYDYKDYYYKMDGTDWQGEGSGGKNIAGTWDQFARYFDDYQTMIDADYTGNAGGDYLIDEFSNVMGVNKFKRYAINAFNHYVRNGNTEIYPEYRGSAPTTGTYYVTTSGSSSNDGLSELTAWDWPTALSNAVAGDVVYVKAGTYNRTTGMSQNNDGSAMNPIKFIGYKNTPGDLTGEPWELGDPVPVRDAVNFPVLLGNDVHNKGFYPMFLSGDYITLRNIQIDGYGGGLIINGSHNTLENVQYFSQATIADSDSGGGIDFRGNSNTGRFLFSNSSNVGIRISGNYNTVSFSTAYNESTLDAMDYYLLTTSYATGNLWENCVVHRGLDNEHNGHGLVIKDIATSNTYKNIVVENTGIEANFAGVTDNLFENIIIYGNRSSGNTMPETASVRVLNGASDNIFKNIFLKDVRAAIHLRDYDDMYVGPNGNRDLIQGGNNNLFVNLIVNKADYVWLTDGTTGATATNTGNRVVNSTFYNINNDNTAQAIVEYQTGTNNEFVNCIFSNCSATTWVTTVGVNQSFSLDHCNFYSTAFTVPTGTSITTFNPLFVSGVTNPEDFQLQLTSPLLNIGVATPGAKYDYRGLSRPQGSGYDLGAYEYYLTGSKPPTAPPTVVHHGKKIKKQIIIN